MESTAVTADGDIAIGRINLTGKSASIIAVVVRPRAVRHDRALQRCGNASWCGTVIGIGGELGSIRRACRDLNRSVAPGKTLIGCHGLANNRTTGGLNGAEHLVGSVA